MKFSTILKTLGMAVLGAVLAIVYTSFQAGDFNLDFDAIWKAAALTAVTYLVKSFFPTVAEPDNDKDAF